MFTGVVLQEKQLDSKGYIDINHLRPYDRDWRIKAIVLRRGVVEPYTTAKGSGTMWKVILMDEQVLKSPNYIEISIFGLIKLVFG